MLAIYCRTSLESESSIEQQKKLGIQFANSHGMSEYRIYEDEGVSGFKDSDDDVNPYNNRPAFTSMINDIKAGKITKVWVKENSRLSRNQYASAVIFRIFTKNKIEIYENNKKMDLNDPQLVFLRQVMDAVSQLERSLIESRTTLGKHNLINKGKRGYSNFFGYKKVNKNMEGKIIWEPVESELNDLRFMYKQFLKGHTLKNIFYDIFNNYNQDLQKVRRYSSKISAHIRHCEYTGQALNLEGIKILKKYDAMELEDISILSDDKYWINSVPYPIKIVSRENWLKVVEKLHANRVLKMQQSKNARATGHALATGLINCSVCGTQYFSQKETYTNNKGGTNIYNYYKHNRAFNNKICPHNPKTLISTGTDEIFYNFFFRYYLVFSENKSFVEETLDKIRHDIESKMTIIKNETVIVKKLQNKIKSLNEKMAEAEDINYVIKNIKSNEMELMERMPKLSEYKLELEVLERKYSKTELENTFVNIKERVLGFFENMETEYQRNELLRIIKKALLYKSYLLIDTGFMIYLFDTKMDNKFDESVLDILNDIDENHFKKYFMQDETTFNKTARQLKKENHKEYENIVELRKKVQTVNGVYVHNFKLKSADRKNILKDVNALFEQLNINYDYSSHSNIIIFFEYKTAFN